jgi:transcriptional antiterminator NusG
MTTGAAKVDGSLEVGIYDARGERTGTRTMAPAEITLPQRAARPIDEKALKIGPAPRWHIVRVEPQREATTMMRLVARQFEVYAPFFPKSVRQNYFRRRIVTAALFPSYLFVALTPGKDCRDRYWSEVIATTGVLGFLILDEEPAVVRDDHLLAIKLTEARLGGRPKLPFDVGSSVEIDDGGLLHGHLGTIEQLDERGRISVLMSLFGRQTRVWVSANQVRVV